MKTFLTLLCNELRIERRSADRILSFIILGFLCAFVISSAITSAFLKSETVLFIFPSLLWIAYIFVSTLAIQRTNDQENENRALEGILLTGVHPSALFFAKVIVSIILTMAGFLITFIGLNIFLNISTLKYFSVLSLIAALTSIGFSSISCLLTFLSQSGRLRGLLLPILVIPLIFPLFFAALELSANLVQNGVFDFSSPWLSLLVSFDLIVITAGCMLFPVLVRG